MIPLFFNRNYIAVASVDIGLWITSLIFLSNHINRKKEDLLLFWFKTTYEIPAKNKDDYKVVGLSAKENKRFWDDEDKFNIQYNKIVKLFIIFVAIVFNFPLFLNTYGFEPHIYLPFMFLNFLHNGYYVYAFFEMVYFNIFFFLTILKFYSKKYDYITNKINELKRKNKISNNQKLSRLIFDFNLIYLEIAKINDLFKNFIGINLFYYFILSTLASFISILVDNRLRIGILSCLFFWFAASKRKILIQKF